MNAGSRSWTDATSNSVLFNGLDAKEYLLGLLRGNLKHGTMLAGAFLHEFTHHWCNRTLLGATLALTELRLLIFTEAYPDGRAMWARDFVGHRIVMNLLRPLAEGLAQIAEFNLTHIDGNSKPGTPLAVATLCFGVAGDDMWRHTMLQFLRHSPEMLDRKASLYFKKFEIQDGYLPGYMTAINIVCSILRRGYNVPFELFLVYLRSYFWDDPVLVNILLSEETNGEKLVGALAKRFNERLWALHISPDLPERIQAFWKDWNPDALTPPAALLACEEVDLTKALSRINNLEQHFHLLVDKDREAVKRVTGLTCDSVHNLLQAISESRRYTLIATAEATVEDDGRVVLRDAQGSEDITLDLKGCDPIPPGSYEISAVVASFGSFVAVLLAKDGYIQGLKEIKAPGIDDGMRQSTLRFVINRQGLAQALEHLRRRFAETGFRILQANIIDQIQDWSDAVVMKIYAAAAAARSGTGDAASGIQERLIAEGVRPLFANDPVLARLVAGMSMLAVTDQFLGQMRATLVAWARLHFLADHTVDDLQKRLDAMLVRDKDHLVLRQEGEFLLFFL